MKIRKLIALGLSAVMALSLVACGGTPGSNNNGGDRPPDPFTEYQTLDEAEKEANFTINLPQSIAGYNDPVYRFAKEDGLLEIIFENGDESITIRKASGSGDISGNYTEFSEKNEEEIAGATVTMKGTDGKVNIATWSKDGYAYSIDCTTAVEKVTMTNYVTAVNSETSPSDGGLDNGDRPPSPFIPYADMTEAAKMAGFDMTVPNTPDGIEAWEGYMIQALYGEDGADMRIRKATGSEDISGDYNEYAQVETVDGVTLKGENNLYSLAVWASEGYSYSINVGEALSQADMLALVSGVK